MYLQKYSKTNNHQTYFTFSLFKLTLQSHKWKALPAILTPNWATSTTTGLVSPLFITRLLIFSVVVVVVVVVVERV